MDMELEQEPLDQSMMTRTLQGISTQRIPFRGFC